MIKLNQNEKSIVSGGGWCEDGNKCLPWNKVNNQEKIDYNNLWCLEKSNGAKFCANTICCIMPKMEKFYDGYTYKGDVFIPQNGTIIPNHTESGYCEFFYCE